MTDQPNIKEKGSVDRLVKLMPAVKVLGTVLVSVVIATATAVSWTSGVENRVANAETELQNNKTQLAQIQTTIQEFKETQEEHNGQDAVFQTKTAGDLRLINQQLNSITELINYKLESILESQQRLETGQKRLEDKIFLE